MKEFNVNKYLLNTKFKLNNEKSTYDLERLNAIKDKVVEMYSFVLTIKKENSKEIISKLYSHLKENNIFENYEKLITPLNNDIVNLDMNNFEKQVWNMLWKIKKMN